MAEPQVARAGPDGEVAVRIRCGGTRGFARIDGMLDERAATATTSGVMRLLDQDVGEIWIDLRGVTRVASPALAALLSWRRRTVRVGARLVLVAEEGPVLHLLTAAAMRDNFAIVTRLPDEPDVLPAVLADGGSARLDRSTLQHAAQRVLDVRADGDGHHVRPVLLPEPSPRVSVLTMDAELAEGVPAHRLQAAITALTAPVALVRRGRWMPAVDRQVVGLLVLEGLIVRRVGQADGFGAELLGPGDILRTQHHPGEETTPGFHTTLTVIQSGGLAVLDDAFAERLRDYPVVATNLVARAMTRAHALTVSMAVAHYPRIERRVYAMLWLLAQRWGRVSPEGVHLRLPLTHAILADLIAARRPSVTLALAQLERSGVLERRAADWVLLGQPPDVAHLAVAAADEPRWTKP